MFWIWPIINGTLAILSLKLWGHNQLDFDDIKHELARRAYLDKINDTYNESNFFYKNN